MRTTIGEATLEELRQSIRGSVITSADDGYETARRTWNGMIDRHPALIVRCAGVADVVAAVQFARSQDLEIAVRGGGHSLPGFSTCDDGIVIDLGPMKGVRVDPAAETAVVEGGVTWKELDHETQAFGLAVTGGLVSSTGVAGFTLGGGIGWLMRTYGLACDNLLGADVVTADGRLVHASPDENPDLFWGLRGGGGNLGIVTAFELRLHRVGPTIAGGPVFYRGDQAAEVFRAWRSFAKAAPNEVTTLINLNVAPPLPFLPETVHGKRIVTVVGMYSGEVEAGLEALAPLRRLGEPIADLVGPMPYTVLQSLVDPLFDAGARNHFKAGYLDELPDAVLDELIRFHGEGGPQSEIHVHQMGGAVARVADEATAYRNRGASYVVNVVARWTDATLDDARVGWARDLYAAVEPFTTGGAYVNFLSGGEDRVEGAYGADGLARLAALKATWDPGNVFHLNQNARPAAPVGV